MLITVVLIFFVVLHYGLTAFMRNRYESEIEIVEVCPNNDQLESSLRNLKFYRYNRTHKSLSYDFSYKRPIDEKVGGTILVDRWGDGGWINIPFVGFQPNICRYILTFFKSAWVNLYKQVGVEHPDRCPVPAGNYSLKNYIMDTTKFSIPFWSGRFRFTSMFQDGSTKEVLYCIIHIVKITELF